MSFKRRESHAVILFDGVCNFCNFWVKFIIRRDPRGRFKFASLQSETGKKLKEKYGIEEEKTDSVILIEDGRHYVMSSAVLRISRQLTGLYKIGYLFLLVPKPVRDALYRAVADRRYRWFGKRETCMIPTPDIRDRFIQDENFVE